MPILTERPIVVNHIQKTEEDSLQPSFYLVATRNENKLKEFGAFVPIMGIDLKVPEIQDNDPLKVLEEKAIQAWIKNDGEPIFVEDSSLTLVGLNMIGPYADAMTDTPEKKAFICRGLGEDRRAVFQVGFAIFDGNEVHSKTSRVPGTIADKPRGSNGFGFDDIFIPDGQVDDDGNPLPKERWKTYAEMTTDEKLRYSPRRDISKQLHEEPIVIGNYVYELPEPFTIQSAAIDKEKLNDPKALKFAYALESIAGNIPNPDLSIEHRNIIHEKKLAEGLIQYTVDPNSPSNGIMITPWDTARDYQGNPTRLKVDRLNRVTLKQMGPEGIRMALAGRAQEFMRFHNETFYEHLRKRKSGEIRTPKRSHKRSDAIEELLKVQSAGEEILSTAAYQELGYAREYSDRKMSRNDNSNSALTVDTSGVPTSFFSFGGMPPTTGSVDVLASAALTFREAYAPRNGKFVIEGELIKLLQSATNVIDQMELPSDIRDLAVAQLGFSIGCQNPEEELKKVERVFKETDIRSVKIYTTNPDIRVPQTAELLRQQFGNEIRIAVGPMVDMKQGRELVSPNIKVNKLIPGHGGGENCTSLKGGGVANSLELAYQMSLESEFDDTAIVLEGGTGNSIGALLGFVDGISLNRRGVAGGIESSGGIYVEHVNGRPAQPYHGSASAVTQWIEAMCDPSIATKRLNSAGKLRNVEGEPNYMFASKAIHTIFDNLQEAERLVRVALADQQAQSINDLRKHVKEYGYRNHRTVTNDARYIAGAHRSGM